MTIITPGEDYHLSLPRGLLGLLHQCVEKSDLLSIFGLLHLLPLFLTNILVQLFAFSKRVMGWEH